MSKTHIRRFNMYEAKTKLSALVEMARDGKEIILMNRGDPVAKIIPFKSAEKSRRLGFAKDVRILSGFDDIPEGFENYT